VVEIINIKVKLTVIIDGVETVVEDDTLSDDILLMICKEIVDGKDSKGSD
tara:strand:- start:410 stop:559 length:150 start_codon:yes stop_codon:yes gene_type:complete